MTAVARWGCVMMLGLAACGGRVDSGRTKPNGERRPAGSAGAPAAAAEGTGASLAAVAPAASSTAAGADPAGAASMAGAPGWIGGQPAFTGCDPPCPPEQYCDYGWGVCVCLDRFLSRLCDGKCVDTTSNPDHCGECHLACDAGTACLVASCWTLEQFFIDGPVDTPNVYLGYGIEELWDPESAAVLADPPDDEFVPASEPSWVALEFGDRGASVKVPAFEDESIPAAQGTLAESSAERRLYVMDYVWAGGTLELRIADGRVVVELTVFGSGLPVVHAHRGTLSSRLSASTIPSSLTLKLEDIVPRASRSDGSFDAPVGGEGVERRALWHGSDTVPHLFWASTQLTRGRSPRLQSGASRWGWKRSHGED